MARISTYIKDTNLSPQDKVIGTDYDNNNATANFPLNAIGEFIRTYLGGLTYTFSQIIPSSTWTIEHNLERHPSVTVVDSSGNMVMGETFYDNNNNITLTFAAPFAGKAYLN